MLYHPLPVKTCTEHHLQAPRFGNGRSIIDLARRVFNEVAKRKGDRGCGAGGRSGDHHGDARALAEDIRLATSAVLQQMTVVGTANVNPTIDDNAAFGTARQREREPPTITTRTTTVKNRETVTDAERTVKDRGADPFLSIDDLTILQKMCNVAGVNGDSASSVLHRSEDLRNAFQRSPAEGGAGFSCQEADAFMRKVAVDRAALDRIGQEAGETSTRLASAEAEAKAQLDEAEAHLSEEQEQGGDEELLNMLSRVKRTKELAARKAREERERELALEKAAQAALQRMGVCPAGYQWNRQGHGWRCSAGGHYVSGGAVSAEMARGAS